MSIPREVNALRYSYLFGVMCSTYIMFTVFIIFYKNNELVPSPRQNFEDAALFNVSEISTNLNLTVDVIDKLERRCLVISYNYLCLHVSSYDPYHLLGARNSHSLANEQSSNFGNVDHYHHLRRHWRLGLCYIRQLPRIVS